MTSTARPVLDRDAMILALADHPEGRWSDGTSSCRGCADRFEEEWSCRVEETPEERLEARRQHRALSRPGWTSQQWREHVVDAMLAGAALPDVVGDGAGRTGTQTGEVITVLRPRVPHGPAHLTEDEADADYLRKAARDLAGHYKPFGSNLRATVVRLLEDAADAIATGPAAKTRG